MSLRRIFLIGFIVSCIVVGNGMTHWTVQADTNEAQDPTIRVALFIAQRATAPQVTVSSPQGLIITDGAVAWKEVQASSLARFSLHQYRLVTMTTNREEALHIAEQASAKANTSIFMEQSEDRSFYEVVVGPFVSEQDALQAHHLVEHIADWNVRGTLYWNAGTFAEEWQARQLKTDLLGHGFPAEVAIEQSKHGIVYSTWVGASIDQERLNFLKQEIQQTFPQLTLDVAESNGSFLIVKTQLTQPDANAIEHFQIGANGQSFRIKTNGQTMAVQEKYGRSYEGVFELTAHEQRLALINELPLENYIYSVVGGEMAGGWPLEALKAQAVAARTYALRQGLKYGIAHVSDTTFDQVYFGVSSITDDIIAAVDATKGEVIRDASGQLIEPLYYSNAGGRTAKGSEVWNNDLDYIHVVDSPDDGVEAGRHHWFRIETANGLIGYVRSDLVAETGETNRVGLPILRAVENVANVRAAPYVDDAMNAPIGQIQLGERLVQLEKRIESNPYRWVRGPFSAETLQRTLSTATSATFSEPLITLTVSSRGESGRVIELKANGEVVQVPYPDLFRSALNGLLSTRFDIEETGNFTILGASGERVLHTSSRFVPSVIYATHEGDNRSRTNVQTLGRDNWIAIDHDLQTRVLTKEAKFRFIGMGFGHGVGMSQWGAKQLAEQHHADYKQILAYYYRNIQITKY